MADSSGAERIHIEQLEVFARLGVPDNERARPQRITINLTVEPKRPFAELGDDISQTINYAEIARSVRDLIQNRSAALIETLASDVVDHVLDKFPVLSVEIELRKYVLPDAQYVAVKLRRGRSHR